MVPWFVVAVLALAGRSGASELSVSTTDATRTVYGCPANHTRPCVPKCCDVDESYSVENRSVCIKSSFEFRPELKDCPSYVDEVASLPVDDRFEYFIGNPCVDGKYILDPDEIPEDENFLFSNGSLWYIGRFHSMADYCLENVGEKTRVFVCFDSAEPAPFHVQYVIYPVGLLASIPFLLATAAIYMGIDAFRDLQGKALACQVSCLAVAYFFLALIQLATNHLNEEVCIAAAFIIQFFFVACFFWLNVISFDIWRNISLDFRHSTNGPRRKTKREKMKFIYYSMYAWYGPCLLSIVSLVMDLDPGIPDFLLKPRFGVRSCWFNSDSAALPYFYGPVGVLISLNVILFVLSARIIYREQHQPATRTLRSSGLSAGELPNKLKVWVKSLKQCIALFLVMGLNWTAEIVSWAIGGSEVVWLVSDVFNTLQGLIIFYLFVIKPKRVSSEVSKRMHRFWEKVSRCKWTSEEEGRKSNHWHANIAASDEELEATFVSELDVHLRAPNGRD